MSDVLSYLVSQLFQIVGLDSVFRVSESNGVECLHENRVYIVIYSKSIYRDGYYQDVVQKMGIVLQIIYKKILVFRILFKKFLVGLCNDF